MDYTALVKQFSTEWPKIAGSESGNLVICASGHSIWSDLEKVPGYIQDKWEQSFDIMAVNDAGMHIPHRLKHWFSNDAWIQRWRPARRPRFGRNETRDEQITLHCFSGCEGCVNWGWPGGGTSSLNAVMTGLALGYDKIYLCGVPLDDNGHYFDPPWVKTNFSRSGGLREWESRSFYFEGKVIPMSGNLCALL